MAEMRNSFNGSVHNLSQARDVYGDIYVGVQTSPRPFHLPPKAGTFVGRDSEVNRIMAVLDSQSSATLAVLSGLAGSGKSAVAVHVSHIAARRDGGSFPGGVLFADLLGYRDVPADSETVLREFVHALGHPRGQGLASRGELCTTYQTLLARQAEEHGRVLVLLENASSAESVRDLIPAEPSHRVLITSRHRLGLLSAVHVNIGVMTDLEAEQLLIAQAGAEVVQRDPQATREVIGFCGHLPLALRIVAALFVDQFVSGMREIAEDLRDAKTRLDELSTCDGSGGEEVAVRFAFELSYHRLPEEQKRMFQALSLDFNPLCSAEKAVVLADVGLRAARRALQGLVRACLLDPASLRGWYRFHDLVYLFASECCREVVDEARDSARERLLALHERVGGSVVRLLTGLAGDHGRFSNVRDVLEWCGAEQPGVSGALEWAQAKGRDRAVQALAVVFGTYYEYQGRHQASLEVLKAGLEAALRAGDRNVPNIEAAIGGLLHRMGMRGEAAHYNGRATRSARVFGDRKAALNEVISPTFS